jgi:hypothetical protein
MEAVIGKGHFGHKRRTKTNPQKPSILECKYAVVSSRKTSEKAHRGNCAARDSSWAIFKAGVKKARLHMSDLRDQGMRKIAGPEMLLG